MKRLAIIVVAVTIFSGATLIATNNQNEPKANIQQEHQVIEKPKPVKPKPVEKKWADLSTQEKIKKNPKKCDLAKQVMWTSDGSCHDKTVNHASIAQKSPGSRGNGSGNGDCAAEIAKYNWPQNIAHAVMLAESGGDPGIVNDNPATGDYSIGCFQVNIKGANALTRPSEAELKNAATNVAWSYNHYKALGNTFGTTGGWGAYTSGAYLKHLR